MNLQLKIFIAASSAAVLSLATTLQGCSSDDSGSATDPVAGASGALTSAGASSVAGGGASAGGASAGASTVAGADSGGGGASAGSGGAAAGSSGSAGSSAGAGGGAATTTFTLQTSTLGQVLANAAGHTLYVFKSDTPSTSAPVSACDTNCQTTWPVYYGNPVSVPDGLTATDFNSFSNGANMQSSYMGWPLYTYAADQAPGDVLGDESASSGSWLAVKIPFTAPN